MGSMRAKVEVYLGDEKVPLLEVCHLIRLDFLSTSYTFLCPAPNLDKLLESSCGQDPMASDAHIVSGVWVLHDRQG